jgi:hypothetical protein
MKDISVPLHSGGPMIRRLDENELAWIRLRVRDLTWDAWLHDVPLSWIRA